MKKWEYDISSHSIEDIGISESEIDFPTDQVIACDSEGHCYYNDVIKVHIDKYIKLLNKRGSSGWELVQLGYHKGSLICFWKREI